MLKTLFRFFCDLSGWERSLRIGFVITLSVTGCYLGLLIIHGLISSQQRRSTLCLAKFFIEFISVLFLFPLENFIGERLHGMCESLTVTFVISFAFNIVYSACFLFARYMQSDWFALSVYIPQPTRTRWEVRFHFCFLIGASISPLFACVIQQFADWRRTFLIGAKVLQFDDLLGDAASSVCAFLQEDIGSGIIWRSVTNCIAKGVKSVARDRRPAKPNSLQNKRRPCIFSFVKTGAVPANPSTNIWNTSMPTRHRTWKGRSPLKFGGFSS
jgi:hypothetical protein